MQNIAFDSHKRYTLCSVEDTSGRIIDEARIEHERGRIREHLSKFTPGSPVAVETIGNWYWIVDEIEEAGMIPRLVHAHKAKMMFGCVNKTDKLDVRGLNRLQRVGTLPTVWIPPMEIRDKRDLARTRMFVVSRRTGLKCRIHAALAKYGLRVPEVEDIFCKRGRILLGEVIECLPSETKFTTECQLELIDLCDKQVAGLEARMNQVFKETEEITLLMTMPGIGFILGVVVSLEVGDVDRFSRAPRLASYSGTTPRVHSSGGRTRYGPVRKDVNHYLKWGFVEAANSICSHRKKWPNRHVTVLYERIWKRRGHTTAIGAVARHLAESTYSVLKKREEYRDPRLNRVFANGGISAPVS